MKIYTITTDDENGHRCELFTDETKADTYAMEWLKAHWHESDGPMPDNVDEAHAAQQENGQHCMWYELHEVDASPAVKAVTRSAQAQLGDLLEQVYQMQSIFDDADGAIQRAVADAETWPGVKQ